MIIDVFIYQHYNNNAVFAGIMIIYGPRLFIYGSPVLFMPPRRRRGHK